MSFKFFPDDFEVARPQRAPDTIGKLLQIEPLLHSEPPAQIESLPHIEPLPLDPSSEPPFDEAASEFDSLSLFLPDEAVVRPGSHRAFTTEGHQASQHGPAPEVVEPGAPLRVDSTALDELRTLLRQTETALERSEIDADALRLELGQLRDISAQLAEEQARLGDACRHATARVESASEVLNMLEGRLGPLEAVRDLTNSTDDRRASLSQLATEVLHLTTDFQAQKEAVEDGLVEAVRVTELLAGFEARVAKLNESGLLGHAADTVARLEQRAVETIVGLDRRVNNFEQQQQTIAQALVEATRATEVLSALDARVATLTGPGQLLDHAAETVGHLERRTTQSIVDLNRRISHFEEQQHTIGEALVHATQTTDVLSALDARVATFTGPGQVLDHAAETVGHLEKRAAEVTVDLERRVSSFEEQRVVIAQAVVEASRATNVLSTVDARVATLTGPGQILEQAAETVAQLERRAAEATVDLERRADSLEEQRRAVAQALIEAARANNVLSTLDARVATLTGPGQLLQQTAETVGQLERRAADATLDLERRIDKFEEQRLTIAQALVEATRATDVLSTVDARVQTLIGPGQALAQAAETVGQLERRATEATDHLEWRVDNLEEQRHTIAQALVEATRATEILSALDARVSTLTGPGQVLAHAASTVGQLERRAADVTVDLDRRLNNFEGQRHTIAQALAEATRATEVLSALDARVSTLTGPGLVMDHAAKTVGQLERRVAEATVDLQRRVDDFEQRKRTMAQALVGVTRATDVLRALDARVATLTGPGQILARAAETVGYLERRAAAATANFEQVVGARSELEAELVFLQKQLERLTESARNLGDVSGGGRQTLRKPAPRWRTILESNAGAAWRLMQRTSQPRRQWAAGLAALAVLALIGSAAMRSRSQPADIASTPRATQRSFMSRSVSGLPSRPLGFATITMPIDRQGSGLTMRLRDGSTADTRPARATVPPPEAVGLPAGRSSSAPLPGGTARTAPVRGAGAARDPVQQFTGMLAIESMPPGAAVFINQQRVGETPLQLKVRAGSHVMWIEREGYERWTSAVLVQADKQTRVGARLQPLRDR